MAGVGPELLEHLAKEHAAALVLYARQWCAVPEDVVQDAFLKLVVQRPPPDHPVPWLFRVVRNGALASSRAARRRRRYEAVAAARAPAWFTDPDASGLDIETTTAALQALPPEQREVIVAHLWGGLTFEQIAGVTDCSAATAYRRFVAGLSALRERLRVPCPNRPTTPS
jgi:RNA polymerase sigma-70 factor (ECF subfamily)